MSCVVKVMMFLLLYPLLCKSLFSLLFYFLFLYPCYHLTQTKCHNHESPYWGRSFMAWNMTCETCYKKLTQGREEAVKSSKRWKLSDTGCCVLNYLNECWFNVCWFSGHMVLTEPCSHIVATVLSKKLDRSWKLGLTSAVAAREGSPSIQTAGGGGARSRSQEVQRILLSTCVLRQQQERKTHIKQKGEEKLWCSSCIGQK